jgi:effector-binding domain-containing protein
MPQACRRMFLALRRDSRILRAKCGRSLSSSMDRWRGLCRAVIQVEAKLELGRIRHELSNALPSDCVGPIRGVLWHRCADSGSLEAEPFVTLKKPIPAQAPCERKQLPEATLACAYSDLDDESAEQAYGAIRRWMNVRGYRLAGPKRELYLDEMLEIQFPLTEN